MIQTRSQRIHRGFHRVGAVLAGLVLVIMFGGLGLLGLRLFGFNVLIRMPSTIEIAGLIFGYLAAAAAIYALSRTIGWIIAGFMRD